MLPNNKTSGMAALVFFLTCVALLVAGVVLVTTAHYRWAWIPFVLLALYMVDSMAIGAAESKPEPKPTPVWPQPCLGTNCGTISGHHSVECIAEHRQTVASAARIEELERVLEYLLQDEINGVPRVSSWDHRLITATLKWRKTQ